MENFKISREMARLILLQRIELASPLIKKLRKIFGRYLFSQIVSKYFINVEKIVSKYLDV